MRTAGEAGLACSLRSLGPIQTVAAATYSLSRARAKSKTGPRPFVCVCKKPWDAHYLWVSVLVSVILLLFSCL